MSEFHFVITIQWAGQNQSTTDGVIEAHKDSTRQQIFHEVLKTARQSSRLPNNVPAAVVFFSLDPNSGGRS
ncbi:hypothetical protein [Spirillospora sp. NBC_01491]|uniref:hypothetical protein n=1 Tax=Spirillospora sp. NBC_01491 TaxID=2976007 RepID=UPI002E354289|nr:hypothetical protein [Spirillospora sp. NBC_01491]